MFAFMFWIWIVLLHWTESRSSIPSCAISCWENTKYVSRCLDDNACRCTEPEYQNSLFQCLYSQCDTAHFGSALHHTISQCPDLGSEIVLSFPQTPNHDALRRREGEYLADAEPYGSGSVMAVPTQSANTYPTQSGNGYPSQGGNNFPTQSAAGAYSFTNYPAYFPLNTATGTTGTHEIPTGDAAIAIITSTTGTILYTGPGSEIVPSIAIPILASVAAFYMYV